MIAIDLLGFPGSPCCSRAFSCYSEWGLLSSCGVQASHCSGFSCCGAQALRHANSVVGAHRLHSTGSVVVAWGLWAEGSVVVARRLSCLTTCGIFPDQGSNLCPLHWQFSSVAQSCLTLCDPMDCSTPDLPVHHQLPEFTQTQVHCVGDAIQPSAPLSSPSPPAFYLTQHLGLFQWISSSHEMAKVLELQLHHQYFQWIFRTDFL